MPRSRRVFVHLQLRMGWACVLMRSSRGCDHRLRVCDRQPHMDWLSVACLWREGDPLRGRACGQAVSICHRVWLSMSTREQLRSRERTYVLSFIFDFSIVNTF